jgi:hypothetical protein
VFGGASLFVPRQAEVENGAELGEVGAHLVFVEAVGDATVCLISDKASIRWRYEFHTRHI